MAHRFTPFRVAAVCSSLILAGGYVYYQSRAETPNRSNRATPATMFKAPVIGSQAAAPPPTTERVERDILMSSSKSAPVFHGEPASTQP
jgi:hypothetical protein